jgi:uncharacterized protein (DUF362 family)
MEGNGPLHGEARKLGVIVIGDDPVAADATMTRLMGLKPEKVRYIHQAGSFLGNIEPRRICQLGESPEALARPFESFQIFLTY